jgi:hypothetical protein
MEVMVVGLLSIQRRYDSRVLPLPEGPHTRIVSLLLVPLLFLLKKYERKTSTNKPTIAVNMTGDMPFQSMAYKK